MSLFKRITEAERVMNEVYEECAEGLDEKGRYKLANWWKHSMKPLEKRKDGSVVMTRNDWQKDGKALLLSPNGDEESIKYNYDNLTDTDQ
jgi:hypothetical protein